MTGPRRPLTSRAIGLRCGDRDVQVRLTPATAEGVEQLAAVVERRDRG